MAILAGVHTISVATPAFPAVNSGPHTLTLNVNTTGNSCSSPTEMSGTATRGNILQRDVKLTITNPANGVVYASTTAEVKHGAYSAALEHQRHLAGRLPGSDPHLAGVVVTSSTTWFWTC